MQIQYVDSGDAASVASALRASLGDSPDGRLAIVSGLAPGEPVYVFRGTDEKMFGELADYQVVVHRLVTPERYEAIVRELDAIRLWQQDHPELMTLEGKLPA